MDSREALHLIASKLEDARDLCSCSRAAKLFADAPWSSLVVSRDLTYVDDRMAMAIGHQIINGVFSLSTARHTRALQKLVIKILNASFYRSRDLDWTGMQTFRASLTVLELSLSLAPITRFWNSINGFPNLSVLKLKSIWFDAQSKPLTDGIPLSFPSLTTVSLVCIWNLWTEDISALQAASPLLESLVMRVTPFVGRANPPTIAHAHRLRELVLESSSDMLKLVGCKALERLELLRPTYLVITGSLEFSRLQHLSLWGTAGLTNTYLATLLSAAVVLETLVLSSADSALSSPVTIKSPTLRSLKYDSCRENNVLQLDCGDLRALELEGCCYLALEAPCLKLSKLCIRYEWEVELLRRLLSPSLGLVGESLIHLDMGLLRTSASFSTLATGVFCGLLGGSCLRRADFFWQDKWDVGFGAVRRFVVSSFSVHTHLEQLRICVNQISLDHRFLFVGKVPGFVMEFSEEPEEMLGFYLFTREPGKEASGSAQSHAKES